LDFPQDSPVMLVSVDCNRSKAIARGSDMIVDLHALLTLRNMDARRFRGVTLLFVAAEASLGGKASAMSSCLNIAQGETFSVSIDLRLIRPVQEQVSKDVRVYLDGVLFDNLQFYGPDRTGSADATGTRGARRPTVFQELAGEHRRRWTHEADPYFPLAVHRIARKPVNA
jgi:hypothetical protein